jgi:hypothetical protein
MYTPCEESVKKVIEQFEKGINKIYKKNGEFGIKHHAIEQCDENPNVFSIAAIDKSDHSNIGMIAYDNETKEICFFCYNPITGKHDEMEGIPEEESRCWWNAKELKIFLMFLTGEVRDIMLKNYKQNL